jgi:hypothetical protein
MDYSSQESFFGFLKALLPTCGRILFKPLDFFKEISELKPANLKQQLRAALAFAIVMGYLRLLLDTVNIYWFKVFSRGLFSSFLPQAFGSSQEILASPLFLLRPVIVFVVTLALVSTGIKLVLGFDKVLVPAFLVVCYKSAADIFYLIPLVGGIFALVWSIALIIVGIRQVYSINLLRSSLAAILMPFLMLSFVLLSMGPAFNRVLGSFYPEIRPQLATFNDLSAYMNMQALVSAAESYKKDLGFYPAHMGVLDKYLPAALIKDVTAQDKSGGYVYEYARPDDKHFILVSRPLEKMSSGRFVFYADEKGLIRLNGIQGAVVSDVSQMEQLLLKSSGAALEEK